MPYEITTRADIVAAMEAHGEPMSYAEIVKATGLTYKAVSGAITHWRRKDRGTAPRIAEWQGCVRFFSLVAGPDAKRPQRKPAEQVYREWYARNRAHGRARAAARKTGAPLDSWAAGLLMLADSKRHGVQA